MLFCAAARWARDWECNCAGVWRRRGACSSAGRRPLTAASYPLMPACRFPVEDVRAWMADMCRRGTWQAHNPGLAPPAAAEAPGPAGEADARAAAQALQSLSASQTVSLPAGQAASVDGGGGGGGGTDAYPAVSSRRQRQDASEAAAGPAAGGASRGQLQRCDSELKRVGALDIMAVAAGLGPSSPTE
jgi:hypothetical protein